MAELTAFSYRSGLTILHALDARFKILFMIMVSIAALNSGIPGQAVFSVMLSGLLVHVSLPIKTVLSDLRYFFFLLFFIFMARMLFTPGETLWAYSVISISREGICDGLLVVWRLTVIMMAGLIFSTTTRSSAVKASVEWFLQPVPLVPARRVGTMMSLIMRFIPVILEQSRQMMDAQRARCVERRKNPVYRLNKLAVPLIRRVFQRADELIVAMESRCYSENRTGPALEASRKDWISLVGLAILCVGIIFI